MFYPLYQRLIGVKYVNQWIIFAIDLLLSTVSTVMAWLILNYVFTLGRQPLTFLLIVGASVVGGIASSYVFKSYKGIIRHSTFIEVGRIMLVAFFKVVIALLLLGLCHPLLTISLKVLLIGVLTDFFLTFFLLSSLRVALIFAYHFLWERWGISDKERLMIIDDDERFSSIPDSFLKERLSNYKVEGYLRVGEKNHLRVGTYKLYSVRNQSDFRTLIDQKHIKAVLFTGTRIVRKESERLIRYCEKEKIRMLVLPSIDEVQTSKTKFRFLPEVRIEDLLGREEIKINLDEIASALKGKVVMVTGAAGSIGSELCRQLCSFQVKKLVLFDSGETPMHNIRLELEEKFPEVHFEPVMGDIRMINRVESVFRRFHPEIVFHAAAYKHVPLMEENPCEAVHTNVYGTRNVANMAVKYGVEKFIMISTDKAVNPTNVMGASKRLAEIYVQSLSLAINRGEEKGNTQFITTRFGNVLGSNGSVIPRFREQLSKGGPLTVTHPDIIRYFMTIPEACRLVLEAAFLGKGGEIFVFDMGTPVKIADLARRMIELAGLVPDKDIEIAYTGLRPGEKLYEELLATKENTLPTENKKIFRAKVREYDYREVDRQIDALTELAIQVDKTETVRKMKEIVPEFKSKNSVYEKLDVKQPSPTPAFGTTLQSEEEQGDKTAEVRGNITTTGKEFS